jgi:hypothetical protein
MWRGLCTAAIAYACGHPSLDGFRPTVLDVPLQAFYRQVNTAAEQGYRALASSNQARAVYFKAYLARAEKQLRPGLTLTPTQ